MASIPDQSFFHLSDLHLPDRAGGLSYDVDALGQLRRVVAMARAADARPTCVIVSGDLSDAGGPESYVLFREVVLPELEAFNVPVLYGLGNHDRRAPFRKAVLGEAGADEEAQYYYKRVVGDLHVFMLDSKVTGKVSGALGPAQRAWLAAELERTPHGQALIVLHHSVTLWGIANVEEDQLADSRELAEILAPHAVLGVLGGHLHFSVVGAFAGSVSITAPGVVNQWDPTCAGMRVYSQPGFNLCTVRAGRLLINPIVLDVSRPQG